jgi:L-alanine-DL-glutamate epimerase-like enolase superfamily enzyme
VYWLEEALPTWDVDGYASLRRQTSLRLAAGEMVRSMHEARDLLLRGGIDVVQPDVVLAGGIGGCRRIAALADLVGRSFSPHTWSTGMGLVANLHLACAVSIDADGKIRPPAGPGLGAHPDLDAIEQFRLA